MNGPAMTENAPPIEGVVARLARDDCERRKFLTMAGRPIGAAAAATSLAAFISACGGSSSSSSGSDLEIVNYALTLEYLETAFYSKVVKRSTSTSSPCTRWQRAWASRRPSPGAGSRSGMPPR